MLYELTYIHIGGPAFKLDIPYPRLFQIYQYTRSLLYLGAQDLLPLPSPLPSAIANFSLGRLRMNAVSLCLISLRAFSLTYLGNWYARLIPASVKAEGG